MSLTDTSRVGDDDNGVLDATVAVTTGDVGIIDGKTSKVRIVLPKTKEDGAADMVEDELPPATKTAAQAKASRARRTTVAERKVAEQAAAEKAAAEKAAADKVAAEAAAAEAAAVESKRVEEFTEAVQETADTLTSERLVDTSKRRKPAPDGIWPRFVYLATATLVNLGDSPRARARKQLSARIAAPLPGDPKFIAVLSRKGGVGKTTVTTLIGMAMADAREDRIVAIDANPDRGTLADRIDHPTQKSVRDLARLRKGEHNYYDISAIVARDETRLHVIASNVDPAVAEAFSGPDYLKVVEVAAHYYSLILTDTGTGIIHSAMTETLAKANQVVIVAGLSVDEARLASETLTWLETNGHEDLARDAIVVLNHATSGTALVYQHELEKHFSSRVRHVMVMPFDSQIAAGGPISYEDLAPETRLAARKIAATIVDSLRLRTV
jgi:MinD-like ATPase involved in chromosome partitioning or flagellar assembly